LEINTDAIAYTMFTYATARDVFATKTTKPKGKAKGKHWRGGPGRVGVR
jgi:hypothetical protein